MAKVIQFKKIYQLKITLRGAKPPIWRTILVPSDIKLDLFHAVIQEAMGWYNSHLHSFSHENISYGAFYDDYGMELDGDDEDESNYRLHQLLINLKDSMDYEYDFGDGWSHKIVLEKILPFDAIMKLPVCIKGNRACPPEDCGGIWGYADLLDIIKDPKHPEYNEMLEWLEEDFDPEFFDIELINEIFAMTLPAT